MFAEDINGFVLVLNFWSSEGRDNGTLDFALKVDFPLLD